MIWLVSTHSRCYRNSGQLKTPYKVVQARKLQKKFINPYRLRAVSLLLEIPQGSTQRRTRNIPVRVPASLAPRGFACDAGTHTGMICVLRCVFPHGFSSKRDSSQATIHTNTRSTWSSQLLLKEYNNTKGTVESNNDTLHFGISGEDGRDRIKVFQPSSSQWSLQRCFHLFKKKRSQWWQRFLNKQKRAHL